MFLTNIPKDRGVPHIQLQVQICFLTYRSTNPHKSWNIWLEAHTSLLALAISIPAGHKNTQMLHEEPVFKHT